MRYKTCSWEVAEDDFIDGGWHCAYTKPPLSLPFTYSVFLRLVWKLLWSFFSVCRVLCKEKSIIVTANWVLNWSWGCLNVCHSTLTIPSCSHLTLYNTSITANNNKRYSHSLNICISFTNYTETALYVLLIRFCIEYIYCSHYNTLSLI